LKNKLPRDDKLYENARIIPISENNDLSSAKDKYVPNQIEIIWKNLKIDVQIKKKIVCPDGKTKTVPDRRHILNNLSGCIKPGEFTAILGPSGESNKHNLSSN
jgi:ABC-type multidrug transport system ATPase subunit